MAVTEATGLEAAVRGIAGDVGDIQIDLTSIERIELNGLDGDDVIDATALTQNVELIVNGGRGDDTRDARRRR